MEKAKKDYEAMNFQLKEELPVLVDRSNQIMRACYKRLFMLTATLIGEIRQIFAENVRNSLIDFSTATEQSHRISLSLSKFEMEASSRKMSRASLPAVNAESAAAVAAIESNTTAACQSEAQRQTLLKKYTKEKLFIVSEKFVANEKLCQLSLQINDLVGLIKPYDLNNQTHRWYVDDGRAEGFVPSAVLAVLLITK